MSTPRLARQVIDAVFLVALAVALWATVATGVPWLLAGGVVAVAFVAEYAFGHGVARDVASSLEAGASGSDAQAVEGVVATLADGLGIDPPRVVTVPDDGGVTVLDDGGRRLLTVPEALSATLDEAALRGILAHELAHVARGHLRRVPVREATRTVVGVAVFWVAFLDGRGVATALFLGAAYLLASVFRSNPFNRAFHVAGSLGVTFLLGVLAAWATRLEELEADDVAVAATSPRAFATGLYHVGAATGTGDGVTGRTPFEGRRSRLERLTAPYPTIESRLARLGVAPEEVAESVETDRPTAVN